MHRMVGKSLFYFSLIELLIVVAVISILVSLLLPALNSARDRARQISCAANAKQFGLAMVQYAGDNLDYQPGFDVGVISKIKMCPQFVSKLHPYLVKGEIPVDERLNKVFFCPTADDQSCWWGSSAAGRGLGTVPLTSYAWNAFAGYETNELYAQRLLTKCKQPSEIAIMRDFNFSLNELNSDYISQDDVYASMKISNVTKLNAYPGHRHQRKDNLLAVDGHVFQETAGNVSDITYNRRWRFGVQNLGGTERAYPYWPK